MNDQKPILVKVGFCRLLDQGCALRTTKVTAEVDESSVVVSSLVDECNGASPFTEAVRQLIRVLER
ncbi:hypothetical protein SynMEDNS5_00293 [Synechococcus sp. MEDNS5]|nr:MAG: hypothetical protein CBC50_00930 [Synechococcus sp. TMED90]QNJ05048.1 hypothetical protein SynMEDNS5_00293 [Synechococcus sp. MEDNS5]|tara:strand:- start:1561 stop:1758 length:198 start_codon:yes stop_codon:yes gene_type:complete